MTTTQPLRPPAPGGLAGRLFQLADAVRRLPPPGHRDPEAFHIAKSELAAELRSVAREAQRAVKIDGISADANTTEIHGGLRKNTGRIEGHRQDRS